MDKNKLAQLSSKRIINLSAVYKQVGLNVDDVNTRLRRTRTKIPSEWLEKIEKKIMDQISEVVQITGIDLTELIPRLIAELDTHFEQKSVFANMKAREVEPIGYITQGKAVVAVYLPHDVYRPRTSRHDSQVRFLSLSKIFDLSGDLELTDRGRTQMTMLAKTTETRAGS